MRLSVCHVYVFSEAMTVSNKQAQRRGCPAAITRLYGYKSSPKPDRRRQDSPDLALQHANQGSRPAHEPIELGRRLALILAAGAAGSHWRRGPSPLAARAGGGRRTGIARGFPGQKDVAGPSSSPSSRRWWPRCCVEPVPEVGEGARGGPLKQLSLQIWVVGTPLAGAIAERGVFISTAGSILL